MTRFPWSPVLVICLALVAAGCGGKSDAGEIPPGEPCNVVEPDCGGGTTCLTESLPVGNGCSSMANICTVACTEDNRCVARFGSGAACRAGCDGSAPICIPPD